MKPIAESAPVPATSTLEPHRSEDAEDGAHSSWYLPAGTDETILVGPDGQPALHLTDYVDSTGERILRLVDDRTGLLIGPTDRRLPKVGIWVGQLRGEAYNQAGCRKGNFAPGSPVLVSPEPTNEHDPNAIVVHDASGQHRAGYFNKQKARAMKRVIDDGAQFEAISLRGTGAGKASDAITVLATSSEVLKLLTSPRPASLPTPAHLR